MSSDLVLPCIHNNGSGIELLNDGYSEAIRAVREARKKIHAIEFHPRDYYVISEDAYQQAVKQRAEMLNYLSRVSDYLYEHYNHINK